MRPTRAFIYGAVYGFTDIVLVPFNGLRTSRAGGRSIFEPLVVIAILIYALAAWVLD